MQFVVARAPAAAAAVHECPRYQTNYASLHFYALVILLFFAHFARSTISHRQRTDWRRRSMTKTDQFTTKIFFVCVCAVHEWHRWSTINIEHIQLCGRGINRTIWQLRMWDLFLQSICVAVSTLIFIHFGAHNAHTSVTYIFNIQLQHLNPHTRKAHRVLGIDERSAITCVTEEIDFHVVCLHVTHNNIRSLYLLYSVYTSSLSMSNRLDVYGNVSTNVALEFIHRLLLTDWLLCNDESEVNQCYL